MKENDLEIEKRIAFLSKDFLDKKRKLETLFQEYEAIADEIHALLQQLSPESEFKKYWEELFNDGTDA